MRIDIADEAGENVLSGAVDGRALLAKLINLTAREPLSPELLILDAVDIELWTSSHMRESLLGIRDSLRRAKSGWYPVLANPNAAVLEEAEHLLDLKRDALLVCETGPSGEVVACTPTGRIEPVQQLTFDLVKARGDTSAADLRQFCPHPPVELTAWNNRLSALAERGLVIEESKGRLKRYRPVVTAER